jgi:uncharacterized protein (DUF934 family)
MALVKDNAIVEDPYTDVSEADDLAAPGALLVGFEQWQSARDELIGRGVPLGIRLKSDESPELLRDDLQHFALIALEFPAFRDGRAYSYARLLRERYGYDGEIRAVGDVLLEQLHFMIRTGFDAFEIHDPDPLGAYRTAVGEFSVWYQPTGDGRPTAAQLRHRS